MSAFIIEPSFYYFPSSSHIRDRYGFIPNQSESRIFEELGGKILDRSQIEKTIKENCMSYFDDRQVSVFASNLMQFAEKIEILRHRLGLDHEQQQI